MSELIERAKVALDLWDRTSAVEIAVLTGMSAARQAYYDAPELVAELVAEIERLRGLLNGVVDVSVQRGQRLDVIDQDLT